MRDGSQRLSHHQIASNTVAHDGCPFLFESKSGKSRYTRLFACISEERRLLYGASQVVQRDEAGRHALGAKKWWIRSRPLLNWSPRLPANSRSCRPASRSKSECTIITRRPTLIRCETSAARVFVWRLPPQSCCRFERTITRMPFASSSGGARIMSLDARSYSKVAAGLPTSTSIFGFGPRVQRTSDVGHFVLLGPFRCRRSP
jgi:hypothetical protein